MTPQIVTIQRTSKPLKLQAAISGLLFLSSTFAFGFIGFAAQHLVDERPWLIAVVAWLIPISLAWWLVIRIIIWWRHG